ncbi:hypothetical protein IWX91DRAFT_156835 [Phyllosticta citricarpa]
MGLFVLEAIIAFIDTSCFVSSRGTGHFSCRANRHLQCWGWMRTSEDLELVVSGTPACSTDIVPTCVFAFVFPLDSGWYPFRGHT